MVGPESEVEPRLELAMPPNRRRWVGWLVLAAAVSAVGALAGFGWKVVLPHLVAAGRLDASGLEADWGIDRYNWKLGGTTMVKRKTRWGAGVTDKDLGLIADLHGVTAVSLNECDGITDAGMPELAKLPDLEDLSVDKSVGSEYVPQVRLTDKGLRALKGLTKLKRLTIRNADVTDAGLDALEGMSRLDELDLSGSKVTDAGLDRIAKLPGLKSLDLSNTAITDAGLARLKSLGNLSFLSVEDTAATAGGVEALRESLMPGAVILSGGKRARVKRGDVPR